MSSNKFNLQDNQYVKPYHHLLDLKEKKFYDILSWWLEYYSYVSFILDLVWKLSKNNDIRFVSEVWCGDGKILCELAKNKSDIYFEGYDLSEKAIMFAKAYSFWLKNLKFYCKDFALADKKYDIILCIETLEHIPDGEIDTFVHNIYNNLKDNWYLIISVPSDIVKLHPKHYRHYNIALLEKHLWKYFIFEDIFFIHNGYSIFTKIINFILANGFFILSFKPLRNFLFKMYDKFLKFTNSTKWFHLVVICKKKE